VCPEYIHVLPSASLIRDCRANSLLERGVLKVTKHEAWSCVVLESVEQQAARKQKSNKREISVK